MASMRSAFVRSPGAWEAAHSYEESGDMKLWQRGGAWSAPSSVQEIKPRYSLVVARLGSGQSVALAEGGVYAEEQSG